MVAALEYITPNPACSGRCYAARQRARKIGLRLCANRVHGRPRRAADALVRIFILYEGIKYAISFKRCIFGI